MNAEQFKKISKVTYVFVKGDPRGLVVPTSENGHNSNYKTSWLTYSGYIEVPYRYDEFVAFNENQRKAICQAELSKAGWCLIIKECNPDSFFEEQSE